MIGLGHSDVSFKNILLATVIVPSAILIGITWGILGVCFAWIVAYPIVFLRNMTRAARLLGLDLTDVLKVMSRPVLASIIMYAMVMGFKYYFRNYRAFSINYLCWCIGLLSRNNYF
jgi:hypothetical protein